MILKRTGRKHPRYVAPDKTAALLVQQYNTWVRRAKQYTRHEMTRSGILLYASRLTHAGRGWWSVGLDRRWLPLPAADVDEPRPHLFPELLVAVVDALEILMNRHVELREGKGRGGKRGHDNTTQKHKKRTDLKRPLHPPFQGGRKGDWGRRVCGDTMNAGYQRRTTRTLFPCGAQTCTTVTSFADMLQCAVT